MSKAYLKFAQNAVKEQEKTLSDGGGRAYEIFRKFISLVNCNAVKERNIAFYADTLCISPNYLCSLIKQASGETVMQWIDKQIVLEAKALLLRGGSSILEISETLNFANPSFFSKFFKRQTGMTPGEFKATSPHSVFR
jgi:AraC-like DNA-binding protein